MLIRFSFVVLLFSVILEFGIFIKHFFFIHFTWWLAALGLLVVYSLLYLIRFAGVPWASQSFQLFSLFYFLPYFRRSHLLVFVVGFVVLVPFVKFVHLVRLRSKYLRLVNARLILVTVTVNVLRQRIFTHILVNGILISVLVIIILIYLN